MHMHNYLVIVQKCDSHRKSQANISGNKKSFKIATPFSTTVTSYPLMASISFLQTVSLGIDLRVDHQPQKAQLAYL